MCVCVTVADGVPDFEGVVDCVLVKLLVGDGVSVTLVVGDGVADLEGLLERVGVIVCVGVDVGVLLALNVVVGDNVCIELYDEIVLYETMLLGDTAGVALNSVDADTVYEPVGSTLVL